MPEEGAGDRTEDATPRKRRREREQGRVAKSRDLTAASVLLGAMVVLRYAGSFMYQGLHMAAVRTIGEEMGTLPVPASDEIMPYVYTWMLHMAVSALPFAYALFLIALIAGVAQVGFVVAWEPLMPDLTKLNPVTGLTRMFGLRSMVTLLMNMLKISIVVGVGWMTLAEMIPASTVLASLEPVQMLRQAGEEIFTLGIRLAMTLFILGLADMGYQWYQQNEDMKMTKQEVKEEMRDTEGDPHIRAKRRQIQRQMAMQRMMQEVPEAEVVVRNPTHYAVAIKYKPDMSAPIVVAKGKDKLALRIIDVAIDAGVPCWQAPPLARELYKIPLHDPIPAALFPAVAEILAHVLRGSKRKEYANSLGAA